MTDTHVHAFDDHGDCACGLNLTDIDATALTDAPVILTDKFSWSSPDEIEWIT